MKTSEVAIPSGSKPIRRRSRPLLWAFLTALAVRLVVVAFAYPGFVAPGRNHWEFGYEIGKIAYSIASGHGFGDPYWIPTGPTAMVTPVFPYLMSLAFLLFGAYTNAAAIAVLSFNSLVSALTCIPLFFLAEESFGHRVAIGAVWTWAFFPYAVYFSADSMWYHSFVALLLTWLLWIAMKLETGKKLWMWGGFGVLWGIAALTTPVVLAVVPFLCGWVCYRLNRNGKVWKLPAFTLALALLATLSPWLIRNDVTFRRPVFLKDNFWMEVCVGNLGNATHWWNDAVHPAGNNTELEVFRQLGELGYMERDRQLALAYIWDHPGIVAWRSIRRFIYMWTGFWSFRAEYLREEPFDLANVFFCTAFTIVAMIGLYKGFRTLPMTTMPYLLVLLSFPLAYYLTHSEISYRQPIDPVLVVFASFAVFSHRKSEQNPPSEAGRIETEAVLVGK